MILHFLQTEENPPKEQGKEKVEDQLPSIREEVSTTFPGKKLSINRLKHRIR